MSETTEKKSRTTPKRPRRARTVHEALQMGLESLKEDLKTMSKEELARRLTTYEPGIPHSWFGRPVEPITYEELLDHFNGGPEPPLRYKDAVASDAQDAPPSPETPSDTARMS